MHKETKKLNMPYIVGIAVKDGVRIREKPEKYSELLCILKKGDTVIINSDGETKDYYKVTIKSIIGYVRKNRLEIK